MHPMRIKKGDQVKILNGKDRGKTGKVLNAFPQEEKVTIEGLNLVKKRVRPKRQGQKGETVNVPRPIAASRVALICKSCGKAVRAGFRMEGKEKVRVCKKCGALI